MEHPAVVPDQQRVVRDEHRQVVVVEEPGAVLGEGDALLAQGQTVDEDVPAEVGCVISEREVGVAEPDHLGAVHVTRNHRLVDRPLGLAVLPLRSIGAGEVGFHVVHQFPLAVAEIGEELAPVADRRVPAAAPGLRVAVEGQVLRDGVPARRLGVDVYLPRGLGVQQILESGVTTISCDLRPSYCGRMLPSPLSSFSAFSVEPTFSMTMYPSRSSTERSSLMSRTSEVVNRITPGSL